MSKRNPPGLRLTEPTYEIQPREAGAIFWMFIASATGMSDQRINEVTNGVPRRFPAWTERTIGNILKNPKVMGIPEGNIANSIVNPEFFHLACCRFG
jgi:hypothetical protein